MELQPLNGRVLIEPDEALVEKVGSLYVAGTSVEKPNTGRVLALPLEGMDGVALGDRVLYKRDSGDEIGDGKGLRLLVESADLLAKFVETDAIPA